MKQLLCFAVSGMAAQVTGMASGAAPVDLWSHDLALLGVDPRREVTVEVIIIMDHYHRHHHRHYYHHHHHHHRSFHHHHDHDNC